MELLSGNIILIIIYFAVVLGIGFWARKDETPDEYLLAGRKVGLFQTAASILAVIGGVILVGQAALAFDLGFGAMWFWVGMAIGLIFLGLTAKKVKSIADEKGFLTISEYILNKFDKKNSTLASVIFFLAFFALLSGQFIAGGNLFAPLLNISYSGAIIILGVGTLFYLFLGGFKAVIKTDFLQFLIMFFVSIFLLFNINLGEYSPAQTDILAVGGQTIAIFLLMGTFIIFSSPDIWQRIFAAKSVQVAKKASYISAGLFVVLGTTLSLIGIAAKNNFPNIDSGEALYYGMFQLLPASLLGLAVIVILAAIMSTIDTELFYLSSSIAKDILPSRRDRTSEEIARIIRRGLLGLAAASMLIAIFVSNILLLLFALISLALATSPVIIGSLFWKIKNNAAFLSMLAGLITFVVLMISGKLTPDTAIVTLPVSSVFLAIGQLIFRGNKA